MCGSRQTSGVVIFNLTVLIKHFGGELVVEIAIEQLASLGLTGIAVSGSDIE